jgi:hypothetical protein
MQTSEVKYTDNPSQFYISYNGFHYKKHSKITQALNNFKNIFNGYWVRMKKKRIKKKIHKKIKRIFK